VTADVEEITEADAENLVRLFDANSFNRRHQ
jgi:hypothetical protein